MAGNDDAKKAVEAKKAASARKPAARSTKLGAFQPLRGTFDAKSSTDDWTPWEPNSREFILLADGYNLGLRLLERPDATASLVELGKACVKNWKTTMPGFKWPGDENKMAEYVNYFQEKYRNQSTRLAVSSKPLGDAYAETVFDMTYVLPDLFSLDPKVLTDVVLDKEIFDQVVQNDAKRARLFASDAQAKAKDNLKAFAQARRECADLVVIHQVLLGAVIFHEFAHCLVFYLGMDGRPNTPPNVTGLSRKSNTGESGAWLEKQVLGGPLAIKDNVLYLVDEKGLGREVDMTKMKDFVNKPETFDLRNGLPFKPNGRVFPMDTRRSPSPSPDTRQRAIFSCSRRHKTAYDVYLGKDDNGAAIHASRPSAVALAA